MPNAPDATPLDGDTLECWSVLAALAAAVPRLRLAPLVTSVTYRHPAVLANIAAAVDNISGGRLLLGIGAGWQENEHAAYGIELGHREGAARPLRGGVRRSSPSLLREQAHHLRRRRTSSVTDAPNQPAAGAGAACRSSSAAAARSGRMRIAARYADEWNAWTTPDVLAHKVGVLRQHCDDLGRDPAEIQRLDPGAAVPVDRRGVAGRASAADAGRAGIVGTPSEVTDIVGRYRDAGADELIVPDFTLGPARTPQGHLRPVHRGGGAGVPVTGGLRRGRVISKNPGSWESTWMASQSRTAASPVGAGAITGPLNPCGGSVAHDDRRRLRLGPAERVGDLHGLDDRRVPFLVVGRVDEIGIEAARRETLREQRVVARVTTDEEPAAPFRVERVDGRFAGPRLGPPRRSGASGARGRGAAIATSRRSSGTVGATP